MQEAVECIQPLFARSLAQPHGGTHALHDGLAEKGRFGRFEFRTGQVVELRQGTLGKAVVHERKILVGRIAHLGLHAVKLNRLRVTLRRSRTVPPRARIFMEHVVGTVPEMKPRRSRHVVHHLDTQLPRTLVGKQGTEKDILQLLAKIGLGILNLTHCRPIEFKSLQYTALFKAGPLPPLPYPVRCRYLRPPEGGRTTPLRPMLRTVSSVPACSWHPGDTPPRSAWDGTPP